MLPGSTGLKKKKKTTLIEVERIDEQDKDALGCGQVKHTSIPGMVEYRNVVDVGLML